jgi:NAD(P)-dependent dehydrogenase (short-subunit alcohol dehydrogenase family)
VAELEADAPPGPGRGAVVAVTGDQRDPTHREALVAAAVAAGGLDLLVLNAGDLGPSPLPVVASVDPAALRAVVEANLVAPLAVLQAALPHLRAAGGRVVAVTSDAAVEAYAGWGAYGASKAALEQAAAVLAVEEAELVVLRVDPGDLRTDMHQAAFPGEDIGDRPEPERVAPAFVDAVLAADTSRRLAVAAPAAVAADR